MQIKSTVKSHKKRSSYQIKITFIKTDRDKNNVDEKHWISCRLNRCKLIETNKKCASFLEKRLRYPKIKLSDIELRDVHSISDSLHKRNGLQNQNILNIQGEFFFY